MLSALRLISYASLCTDDIGQFYRLKETSQKSYITAFSHTFQLKVPVAEGIV